MAFDEKVSKQANVNCKLSNDTQVKFYICPMQWINSVSVKQNENVNIEQNEIGEDCPKEYKPKIDFFSVFILSEKKFGQSEVDCIK